MKMHSSSGVGMLLRRLPDSAFDLMDEACASARLQQDLQPEYIEAVEQHKKHKEAYIRALEVCFNILCPGILSACQLKLAFFRMRIMTITRQRWMRLGRPGLSCVEREKGSNVRKKKWKNGGIVLLLIEEQFVKRKMQFRGREGK